jgi:hypothetical protein
MLGTWVVITRRPAIPPYSFYHVSLHALPRSIAVANHEFGKGKALRRCSLIPLESLSRVFCDASAEIVTAAQFVLRLGIPLFCLGANIRQRLAVGLSLLDL